MKNILFVFLFILSSGAAYSQETPQEVFPDELQKMPVGSAFTVQWAGENTSSCESEYYYKKLNDTLWMFSGTMDIDNIHEGLYIRPAAGHSLVEVKLCNVSLWGIEVSETEGFYTFGYDPEAFPLDSSVAYSPWKPMQLTSSFKVGMKAYHPANPDIEVSEPPNRPDPSATSEPEWIRELHSRGKPLMPLLKYLYFRVTTQSKGRKDTLYFLVPLRHGEC